MKATELMIGDWVLYKSDAPQNAFPVQITHKMFVDDLVRWQDRFDPISLTPEILEKNGFAHDGTDYNIGFVYDKSLVLDLCFDGSLIFGGNLLCKCKYVHTLQHALRLCGIEKEIII